MADRRKRSHPRSRPRLRYLRPPPPPIPRPAINKDPGGSGKYEFSPSEITFNGGQKVTFELTSETEFHTFTVEDLDIDEALGSGETVKLEFTFDRAGEFELKCLAHPQMTGLITVQQARSALHETRPSAS